MQFWCNWNSLIIKWKNSHQLQRASIHQLRTFSSKLIEAFEENFVKVDKSKFGENELLSLLFTWVGIFLSSSEISSNFMTFKWNYEIPVHFCVAKLLFCKQVAALITQQNKFKLEKLLTTFSWILLIVSPWFSNEFLFYNLNIYF